MQLQTKARDPKFTFLPASLLCLFLSVMLLRFLGGLPATEESQVYSALGCRASDTVLILRVSPDGMVRGPGDMLRTVEETTLLLPSWIRHEESPVIAIMATEDTPMSVVHPLLAVAEDLGHRRAIFAVNQGSTLALLSDQQGKLSRNR